MMEAASRLPLLRCANMVGFGNTLKARQRGKHSGLSSLLKIEDG